MSLSSLISRLTTTNSRRSGGGFGGFAVHLMKHESLKLFCRHVIVSLRSELSHFTRLHAAKVQETLS